MAAVTALDGWEKKKFEVQDSNNDVNEVRRQLEGWRETLLPLNRLFNWDKPYYPAIIFAFTTFIFTLIWYFDTSVLTTVCIIGLLITLTDFLVPIIGPNILGSQPWTGIQERQFDQICERICHFRQHAISFRDGVCGLKVERPRVYFLCVVGSLLLCAWIGSSVDNLCLVYIIVTMALLLPGLRRHGVIQKYFRNIWALIKGTLFRKKDTKKDN